MPEWTQNAHPMEGIDAARLAQSFACLAGNGRMIQIAPQVRILVAVEAIDCRKGIDAIAQLCREKLNADPFSGYLFLFRNRRGTAIRALQYDRCDVTHYVELTREYLHKSRFLTL